MTRFAFDRLPEDALIQADSGAKYAEGLLDRAAHLRGDAEAQKAALEAGRIFPIWRGRVLLDADGAPVHFAAGHPIFGQGRAPIYLGHCPSVDAGGRTHWFAVDISTWEPEAGAPAVEAFLDPSEIVHPAAPDARFVELRAHLTSFEEGWGERFATARALTLWHVSHRFCAACGQESAVADAGWQRRCESCGTSHFPRTDPVVIMLVTRGNSVLVGRNTARGLTGGAPLQSVWWRGSMVSPLRTPTVIDGAVPPSRSAVCVTPMRGERRLRSTSTPSALSGLM